MAGARLPEHPQAALAGHPGRDAGQAALCKIHVGGSGVGTPVLIRVDSVDELIFF